MISARQTLLLGQGFLALFLGCATTKSADTHPADPQSAKALPGNPPAATASAAPPAAAPLATAPTLHETGRIAAMNVSNTGLQIDAPPPDRSVAREQRVESAEVADGSAPPVEKSAGVVDPALLKREIRTRFVALNDCPREVARHSRTATTLRARRLTLRWTILPSGQVAHTTVVATSPVDVGVMDCVKRQMSVWTFAPPKGGSFNVERAFAFRR
jgi:hypothetical protein